jgi:putative peptide zinc metalloprotease protein
MNLTRVLDVALPEIPARNLSERAPRMPPDVVFKEHIEEGKTVIRVLVPSQESMFRFPRANWTLAQLFDGQHSYEEIAEIQSARTGAEFSVEEVREFAASLESLDFWYKTPQEKNILLMQKDAQKRKKALKAKKSKYGDLAEITFPAVNPDNFLTWLHSYTSFIYTWWFTLLSLSVFAIMAGITVTFWSEIGRDTLQFFNFSSKTWRDVAVFYVAAVVAMCWHEIGHGHACKHYGGRVPSMGFLLIYLTPAFYTDTSEGQVMATRYERMIIALAGAWSELYICAVATVIWWMSPPDTSLHSAAYMMMLITGIASILINFNPLMKLDGYYIMCELFGFADLKEDSTAYLSTWVKRHIWKLPVEVPYVPRRWRAGYVVYALISGIYSYTVLYVVARFVGNVFRNFDPDWSFIPELATAAVIFRSRIRTLGSFMKFVYLDKKDRVHAWFGSRLPWVMAGIGAILLLLPLWHDSVQGRFVLEPGQRAVVRSRVSGTVTNVEVDEGVSVEAGKPLVQLRNLPLQSELARAQAEYLGAAMRATSATLLYADFGQASQERERSAKHQQVLNSKMINLEVVSPISGIVLTPRVADLLGSYVQEGTELLEIADLHVMRARISVSEHDVYKLAQGSRVRLQVEGLWKVWESQMSSLATQSSQVDPALADENNFKGLRPPKFYVVEAQISNSDGRLRPGMIGVARIYGVRRSIAGLVWQEGRRFFVRKLW